jgi:hypothetical protein
LDVVCSPGLYQQGAQGHGATLLGFEAALLGLGLFPTYRAYAKAD